MKAFDNVGVTRVKWYVDGSEVAYDQDGAPWPRMGQPARRQRQPPPDGQGARRGGQLERVGSIAFGVHNEPCGQGGGPRATWDHVVWIVFENKDYKQIVGSPNAPYLNGLSARAGSRRTTTGWRIPACPTTSR